MTGLDEAAIRADERAKVRALIERLREERCVSHNYGVALDDLTAAMAAPAPEAAEEPEPDLVANTIRLLNVLPDAVRAVRERRGLSVEDAAKQMGLSAPTLDWLERGQSYRLSTLRSVLTWLSPAMPPAVPVAPLMWPLRDKYPPEEGWFTFGTHIGCGVAVEFSQDVDEVGDPLYERVLPAVLVAPEGYAFSEQEKSEIDRAEALMHEAHCGFANPDRGPGVTVCTCSDSPSVAPEEPAAGTPVWWRGEWWARRPVGPGETADPDYWPMNTPSIITVNGDQVRWSDMPGAVPAAPPLGGE